MVLLAGRLQGNASGVLTQQPKRQTLTKRPTPHCGAPLLFHFSHIHLFRIEECFFPHGPQCSCRCGARVPFNIDANRCDESNMHVLVVESGILDHNATVGETHAFALTLTPIVATIQKCCIWRRRKRFTTTPV
mgnify:CR=1 FL=1